MNLDKIDPHFSEDLEKSKAAVLASARYILSLGFPVTINPTYLRPSCEVRNQYRDNGDLTASFTFEVKHRHNIDFTGPADYPYQTVFVDRKDLFESKNPAPFRYFIWNKDLSGLIVIDVAKTRKHWKAKTIFNPRANRDYVVYECPLQLATFHKMPIAEDVIM